MTVIECACGCGQLREDRDERGRPRRFIHGHHRRIKKIKRICEQCGKPFEAKTSEINKGWAKFCSKECYFKSRIRKIKQICEQCGKPFETKPSLIKMGNGKFCSTECSTKSQTRKVKRICEQCGKQFEIRPSYVKNGGGKFCSKECYGKSERTKVKRTCKQCGKQFEIIPSFVKNGGGKFCSNECNGKWARGENSSNWKGGTSFEPYCQKFNEEFKEHIRDKYDRRCFLCPTTEAEQIADLKAQGKQPYKLAVHHVNYNKNCLCDDSECEFVPLCAKCHGKTSHNREYWEALIISKLEKQ